MGGRKGKAGGKGEPEEGKERREGDKSPAWSSQDLGSTAGVGKLFGVEGRISPQNLLRAGQVNFT